MKVEMELNLANSYSDGRDNNRVISEKLREVADRIEKGEDEGIITDVNGNRVGKFRTPFKE